MAEIGGGVAHVLMAIETGGTSIVCSNVEPPVLKEMGAELVEMADEAMLQMSGDAPIH